MEKIIKKLPLTIQYAKKQVVEKEVKKKKKTSISIKKYNTINSEGDSFYKPISKIILRDE